MRKDEQLRQLINTNIVTLYACDIQDILIHKQYDKVIKPLYNWINNLEKLGMKKEEVKVSIYINNDIIVRLRSIEILIITKDLRNIDIRGLDSHAKFVKIENIHSLYDLALQLNDIIYLMSYSELELQHRDSITIEKIGLVYINECINYIEYHNKPDFVIKNYVSNIWVLMPHMYMVLYNHGKTLGLRMQDSIKTLKKINNLESNITDIADGTRETFDYDEQDIRDTELHENLIELRFLVEYAIHFFDKEYNKKLSNQK